MENIVKNLPLESSIISSRLQELEKEWDMERVSELNSSLSALSGTLLGKIINKHCSTLPILTTTFLMQETTPYLNPPLSLYRSLGYRSKEEIENEKQTLKAMLHQNESDNYSYGTAAVA